MNTPELNDIAKEWDEAIREDNAPDRGAGRLAYWTAKAELSQKVAIKQLLEGKAEAGLDNLRRMAYALQQAELLTDRGAE